VPARKDGQQPEDAEQAGEHPRVARPRLAWNDAVLGRTRFWRTTGRATPRPYGGSAPAGVWSGRRRLNRRVALGACLGIWTSFPRASVWTG
jgi:hypothetical protein